MQTAERLKNLAPSLTLSINSRALEMRSQGIDVISLAVGEPDFPTPKHICEAAKAAIDANFCRYTAVAGITELRVAAGAYFKNKYGVPVGQESIIIGAGGKHCIFNLLQALLNPGDAVIIPAPYWVSYPDMVHLTGAEPIFVQASAKENFKITVDALDRAYNPKTKLLILNSPCNPTGAVYSEAELDALLEWAWSKKIFVLSDEIYDQLVFAPAKMASAIRHFEKQSEYLAVLNGLSKSYAMTGWRVGFLATNADLIKKISMLQGHSTSGICSIAQKAALAALQGPENCLEEMRKAFQKRRDLAMDLLKTWDKAYCPKPDGAFYLFVDVSAYYNAQIKTSTELCSYILEKAKVAVVPGAAFGDDKCIRLSYAVADSVLEDAIQRIGSALKQL